MELLSPMHLLIIFLVALLLFGPKKLPELGKGIGEGFRALKEGMKDKTASDEQAKASTTQTPSNPETKG
jgi:sec-independent protein translocase protein TatA